MSNARTFRFAAALFLGGAFLASLSSLPAQQKAQFNERSIKPELNVFDKGDVWTFDFRFKDPRIITADVPGRGKKIIWYMWYQVINKTGDPRVFIPDFELVTTDKNTLHADEVLPSVEEVIKRIEDPTGRLNIKNSVTISKETIPITKENATDRAITGVAIWSDVYDRAASTTQFSIFISGLSNGWTEDDNKVIRRKTLQLNFRKFSDAKHQDSDTIQWIDNPSWIYRASSVNLLGNKQPMMPPMPKLKDGQ